VLVAEPKTSKKPWEGSGPGGLSWKAILLGALGIYAILLIILNSKQVTVDFVFFSRQTRDIWLVLLSMALGALIVWLFPRWRRRRRQKHSSHAAGEPSKDFWHGSAPGGLSWKAIVAGALGIYALLLIIMNSKQVSVNFVFFSAQTRLIWLVLLCMALGGLIMALIPRWRQHRRAEQPPAAGDVGTAG
jgi:uncharacterized integral membrane protein